MMFIKRIIKNLFSLLFVALDFGTGESTETTQETTETNEEAEPQVEQAPAEEKKNVFEIDGEEVDLETIKSWRQGNLRQSDYTRKTQEVARARKELDAERERNSEALEVYNFLQANPNLTQKLYEMSLEEGKPLEVKKAEVSDPRVDKALYELEVQKIETELSRILKEDPNVNDVELLNIANDNGVNIQTAYTLWRGQNVDKLLKQQQKELADKLKNNTNSTSTLINPSDKGVTKGLGLTEVEVTAAKQLGMTTEEYAKWKNFNPNK